jgi:hypothetical protein
MLSNNYKTLQPPELKIFNKIKIIFIKYLYNPRHEPINLNLLYNDLKVLGNLIYQADKGRKKTTITSSKLSSSRASGIRKTRKNKHIKNKTSLKFVRKPKVKRFKNPIYLSLK